jgi:glycosyltransferase involved in cell wall biosynthesis
MKVLFNTYPLAFQQPGGGELIMVKLKEELSKLDVQVDFFNPYEHKLNQYDIFHHFSLIDWQHFKSIKSYDIPLVCTPTSWTNHSNLTKLKELLKENLLKTYHQSDSVNTIRSALKFIDHFYPTSATEAELLKQFYDLNDDQMETLPNGVDPLVESSELAQQFTSKFNVSDYALYVGSIRPNKNVDLIIKSCQALGLPLVILGTGDAAFSDYYERCQKIADSNQTHFIGSLEHMSEDFVGAYNGAKVIINASDFETCSLVGLEAASLGKPLVMTNEGATTSIYQDYPFYVTPKDQINLQEQISKALSAKTPNQEFKSFITKNHAWPRLAEKLKNSYQKIIEDR